MDQKCTPPPPPPPLCIVSSPLDRTRGMVTSWWNLQSLFPLMNIVILDFVLDMNVAFFMEDNMYLWRCCMDMVLQCCSNHLLTSLVRSFCIAYSPVDADDSAPACGPTIYGTRATSDSCNAQIGSHDPVSWLLVLLTQSSFCCSCCESL